MRINKTRRLLSLTQKLVYGYPRETSTLQAVRVAQAVFLTIEVNGPPVLRLHSLSCLLCRTLYVVARDFCHKSCALEYVRISIMYDSQIC